MTDSTVISRVADSFQNLAARLGWGTNNLSSGARYVQTFTTRDRTQLDAAYRGNWVVGQAVDVVAEDMTRAGIEITGGLKPDQIGDLNAAVEALALWQALGDTVKWSRLYGGAIAVMLIDGQALSSPLRLDTVRPGQFKGLLVLDRWSLDISTARTVQVFGPDLGQPETYKVLSGDALVGQEIHYSRVIRLDGVPLPWQERQRENGWGQSVLERIWDRLVAFDSATAGAAQLVFKAHLRTMKIEGYRDVVASGGRALEGVMKQLEMIRFGQSSEGLTVIDGKDVMEFNSYTFTGLPDLLLQFAQQLSGALQIPLVRLLGQSPAGLNSTGESDLANYMDGIHAQQEGRLRRPLTRLLAVLCRSVGIDPPDDLAFTFRPLWQMKETDKAAVAKTKTETVLSAHEAGIVSQQTALRELRLSSHSTGVWSQITDEDVEAADDAPPDPSEVMPEAQDVPPKPE